MIAVKVPGAMDSVTPSTARTWPSPRPKTRTTSSSTIMAEWSTPSGGATGRSWGVARWFIGRRLLRRGLLQASGSDAIRTAATVGVRRAPAGGDDLVLWDEDS